jgi:hypothetical protein
LTARFEPPAQKEVDLNKLAFLQQFNLAVFYAVRSHSQYVAGV